MAAVLGPPLPRAEVHRRRPDLLVVAGLVLIAAAIVAGAVWLGALSPAGYTRFEQLGQARTVTVRTGGTYLFFQEFTGAAAGGLPPPLELTVTASGGRDVPVRTLAEPGTTGGVPTYRFGPYEGRAFAAVDLPGAGDYLVQVRPRSPVAEDLTGYEFEPTAGLALGREASTSWAGSLWFALAVAVVPFVAGASLLVLAARRRRRAASGTAPGTDNPAGVAAGLR